MTATKPRSLLVPALYEEGTATVSWERTQADSYTLDIVFDEEYDRASRGASWASSELADLVWSDQNEVSGLRWQDIHERPSKGLMWRNLEYLDRSWGEWNADATATWSWMQQQPVTFTVYEGYGEDIPAPDQGLAWGNRDNTIWNWLVQEGQDGLNWKEMQLLPSVGLIWGQHDLNKYTWASFQDTYDNWAAFENQPPRGLSWISLQGRWQTWEERESSGENGDGLSWFELDHLPPDNETHGGTVVDIPLYTKASMLRVRALEEDHDPSEYLTTGMINHLPRSLKNLLPVCLHIPQLHEGNPADIAWGDLYGAQGFVLERSIDGGKYQVIFEGKGLPVQNPDNKTNCAALSAIMDVQTHFHYLDSIPFYAQQARYRVKAYNTTDTSLYLESVNYPVTPVFTRRETRTIQITAGQVVSVQLHTRWVADYRGINITLEYDSSALRLEDTMLQKQYGLSLTNADNYNNLEIIANTNGKLVVRCRKDNGNSWTGYNTLLCFTALKSGSTSIKLS